MANGLARRPGPCDLQAPAGAPRTIFFNFIGKLLSRTEMQKKTPLLAAPRGRSNRSFWVCSLSRPPFFSAGVLGHVHFLLDDSYLVDPASSHMLVSKIKPCMSKYKQLCTVKLQMAH